MNYDNQKLKSYLLGELSGAETEVFDELTFTDESFKTALSAAERDLIDAYLHKELSGEESEKVEKIYSTTAHRREKIEFARAFQTFAGKEMLTSETKSETEKSDFFSAWNIFGNRALQFGFAAAALLVLFFGLLWFGVLRRKNSNNEIVMQKTPTPEISAAGDQNDAPKNNIPNNKEIPSAIEDAANDSLQNINQMPPENTKNTNKNTVEPPRKPEKETPVSTPQKPLIAAFVLAPPLRSANKIPLFDVPKNATQITVELQLEANEYETYHVTLTNETGNINLWRRGSLRARNRNEAKVLNLSFPAKLLTNGFYSLTLSGINKNGEAEILANYPFRAAAK